MLVNRFLETALRYSDRSVAKDASGELTFSQLVGLANAIRGVAQEETSCPRVGLMLPTTGVSLGAIMGILWAGRTFVPLNYLLTPAELSRIVADAGIDLILGTEVFQETLSQMPVRVLYLEKLDLARRCASTKPGSLPPPPQVADDDIAGIVYTSATTGRSKGVCLSHRNLAMNSEALVNHIRLVPEDRLLAVLPNFHVFGLTVLNVMPMLCGPAVTCIPRFTPVDVHRAIVEDRISVLIAVPSMYGALASLKNISHADFAHVRVAVSGGEPLPRRVYESVCERMGVRIVEGYGMTETSPAISVDLPWAHKVGTVGPPLAGFEIQLRDAEGQVVLSDVEGELHVRGPMVMKGYYHLPEETAAVIDADGWLRTGDIVRIDSDGYIRITGRAKDLIIVAGENVFPREIEEVLDQHPAVAQSAVIGRKDDLRGEAVVGFVVPREGQAVTSNDLRAFCRKNLAGFKVPREIHIRADLPRGPTGKVLKRALSSLLETDGASE